MVRRRSRLDSEVDYTRNADENSQILLKEKFDLLRWKSTVEITTPNLFIPTQIASYVESLPFSKIAVSKNADRFAIMSHGRKLEIFGIGGQTVVPESEIDVLPDDFASYCLLSFSESGNLILSTRSDAHIDIFDQFGFLTYTIRLESPQSNFDLLNAVSCMQTVALGNENSHENANSFLDTLYVLQYNGTFSVFKIGRLSGYFKVASVSLDIGLVGTFKILPQFNLLLVSAHYKGNDGKPDAGLNSFRTFDSSPYLEPIKTGESAPKNWLGSQYTLARLPFSSGSFQFLSTMVVNSDCSNLCAVSTGGDFYSFELPSTRILFSVPFISGPKPQQVEFVDENEVCVLFSDGGMIRASLDELQEALHACDPCERFAPRSTICAPSQRQLFVLENQGVSAELCEAAAQRASLAVRLWLSTFWTSFKQLVGMAVGEAAAPLHKATHVESLNFVLWHAPTVTLQELFERTLNEKDYDRARSLAASYISIDNDIVLKREWKDACSENRVTEDTVENILGEIADSEWRAEACWASDAKSRVVQLALIKMGIKMGDEAPTESRVRVLHNARVLEVIEDDDLYMELREFSLLKIALHLAERVELSSLERLFSLNEAPLAPYALTIVEAIPACVPPSRYEQFLPMKNGDELQIEKNKSPYADALEAIKHLGIEERRLVESIDWDLKEGELMDRCSGSTPFPEWTARRVLTIDTDSGLPSHAVQLYNIAVQHGFEELRPSLTQWLHYETYLNNCSIVNASFDKFLKMSTEAIIYQYMKLTETELVSRVPSLISLLEWKAPENESVMHSLLPLLVENSSNNLQVLNAVREVKPEQVTEDIITKCLMEYQHTGNELLSTLRSYPLCPSLSVCLHSLLSRGVRATFRQISESLVDKTKAMGLLVRMASANKCSNAAEWETLRHDVITLATSVYEELMSHAEAMDIVVKEFLADEESSCSPNRLALFLSLSRDVDPIPIKQGLKLSPPRSADILLRKSDELLQSAARDEKQMAQIQRAKFLAQSASKLSKAALDQLKAIELVELALELGTRRMPVAVRYTDPYVLLDEIVQIGNNYKLGKKVAKLAVLMNINTPVASALSMCALTAVEREDEEMAKKYLHEVMAKARGIEKVHQLCVQLIKSPYLKQMKEDIYACALLNSPPDCLEDTMYLIESCRDADKLKNERKLFTDTSDALVLDEMYTKADHWECSPSVSDPLTVNAVARDPLSIDELATAFGHLSSSAAIASAMWRKSEESGILAHSWTSNDHLIAYESALRFYEDKLNGKLVEQVPSNALINMQVAQDSNIRPLDRLTLYGCDRERFFVDPEYRKESILGLAMTEDDVMFSDSLDLCQEFKLDLFDVHIAGLKNAITSLPPSEASKMIKQRGHLKVLHQQSERFHRFLRSSVLPQVESNDAFRLYLSVFCDETREKNAIPALKKLMEFSKSVNLRRAYCEVSYLSQLLINLHDQQLNSLAPLLPLLPTGLQASDSVCRVLLEGTELRPPSSALTLWNMCRADENMFLDIVAIKQRSDEISYLAAIPLETVPDRMREVVEQRRSELGEEEETKMNTESQNGWGDWGNIINGGGGTLVNRRKK